MFPLSQRYSKWYPALGGLLVCSLTAGLVSLVFSTRAVSSVVPFAFLGVVVLVAIRCGAMVGIAGSFIAALIFAYRLYPPVHSLAIQSPVARANLAWMVLAGVAFSFLLAPPSGMTQPRK